MKIIGKKASIIGNTNKLYSSSLADWSGIREGSYFKFVEDNSFHVVNKKEKIFYIKDAEVLNSTILKINSDISAELQSEDILTITYKEYEISRLVQILNGGKGYRVGDILFIKSGTPSSDVQNNISLIATFEVAEIQSGGAISKINIKYHGKYLVAPENRVNLLGGNGEEAFFEVEFKLIQERQRIEKDIKQVEIFPNHTLIHLVYGLPEGLKEVKISTEKWIMFLDSDYMGDTKLNKEFEIAKDFTFNYRIPLLVKNSFAIETVFNEAVSILENKILELENRITLLENKKN